MDNAFSGLSSQDKCLPLICRFLRPLRSRGLSSTHSVAASLPTILFCRRYAAHTRRRPLASRVARLRRPYGPASDYLGPCRLTIGKYFASTGVSKTKCVF
ncbi:hypothetical protein J6590_085860 [Homalodisca vitripennis]|nr:hypothetical protein J6590_077874 [Homalodisca vitripennis]KAG8324706.1 hypothetical protein J6590_085860 [Homalodisca vitripennis]